FECGNDGGRDEVAQDRSGHDASPSYNEFWGSLDALVRLRCSRMAAPHVTHHARSIAAAIFEAAVGADGVLASFEIGHGRAADGTRHLALGFLDPIHSRAIEKLLAAARTNAGTHRHSNGVVTDLGDMLDFTRHIRVFPAASRAAQTLKLLF
ncbi:MAG TPA: hypothetical protein VKT52_00160, partial [Ktedonobacterales bacterium]|nr:hypothetical protein [Ktedonobacterales bacterium]